MPYIKTKDEVEIFYKDWGPKNAPPIVFHHGWPLSSDDWDAQMMFFLEKGYRVIAHDRRGQHAPAFPGALDAIRCVRRGCLLMLDDHGGDVERGR